MTDQPPQSPREIVYSCPQCSGSIAIDERAAGMTVDCPYCSEKTVVPAESEPAGAGSGAGSKGIGEKGGGGATDSAGEHGALPPKREKGEHPRGGAVGMHLDPEAEARGGALPPKRDAPPPPVSDDSLIAAIARGDMEIPSAKLVGKKVMFGCPFCARPIQIRKRAQGREMVCPECSGKLVAPDLSGDGRAKPLSGEGGHAGGAHLPTRPKHEGPTRPEHHEARGPAPVAGDPESMSIHRLNADRKIKLVPRAEAEAGFELEDAWASYPDASSVAHFWTRYMKRLVGLAMLGVVVATTVVSVILIRKREADAQHLQQDVGKGDETIPDSPAQKLIRNVEGFASANTVRERLQYVRDQEEVLPKMQLYYGRRLSVPEFPALDALTYRQADFNGVKLARIESLPIKDKPKRALFFEVYDDGRVALDWESAVGFCDVEIVEFERTPPLLPVEMRVLLRPSDYYNYEFADENLYSSYEITDLERTAKIYGYALRDSAADVALSGLAPPEGEDGAADRFVNCIVVLRGHESGERRTPAQVWIESVVTNGWLDLD